MSLILDGTNGLSDVDGSAATPAIRGTDANTGIFFGTDIIGFSEGGVEAMRLDASGNLGIGTTSPNFVEAGFIGATVNGSSGSFLDFEANANHNGRIITDTNRNFSIQNPAAFAITFATNGAEKARITSGGDLLVGRTDATINTTNFGFKTSQEGLTACSRDVNGASATLQVFGNAGEFRVVGNGNAQNTNNSYGAISDVKLKENIVDATSKLDKLNQVRVVNYNLIGQEQKQIGVIAQELEQIFPSMVEQTLDCDSKGNDLGTTTKSVKYSVFVPMLIKAIQEQQAIIESLKARLDAANL